MSQYGILSTFDHNIQSWQIYKGRLQQWFIANCIEETEDPPGVRRRAIFLSSLSEATYQLLADLTLPEDLQEVPFENILELLDNHFTPKRCGFEERSKFYTAAQYEGESFPQWAARLRGLTAYCGFLNVEESLRDHFIMAMIPGAERGKLFAQDPKELTLAASVALAEGVQSARVGAVPAKAAEGTVASFAQQLLNTDLGASVSGDVICSACGFKDYTSAQFRFAKYTRKERNIKGNFRRIWVKTKFFGIS